MSASPSSIIAADCTGTVDRTKPGPDRLALADPRYDIGLEQSGTRPPEPRLPVIEHPAGSVAPDAHAGAPRSPPSSRACQAPAE
jgi:hypothetical protein